MDIHIVGDRANIVFEEPFGRFTAAPALELLRAWYNDATYQLQEHIPEGLPRYSPHVEILDNAVVRVTFYNIPMDDLENALELVRHYEGNLNAEALPAGRYRLLAAIESLWGHAEDEANTVKTDLRGDIEDIQLVLERLEKSLTNLQFQVEAIAQAQAK